MMKRKKPGPHGPTKFTSEVVRKLEQAFAIGCTVVEACIYANISRETFYRNCKESSELYDRFMALRETPILKARQTIVNNLGNPEHAKWYLKNKCADEFSGKVNLPENATPLFSPIQILLPSKRPIVENTIKI